MAQKEIRQLNSGSILTSDLFLMQKSSNNKTVKVEGLNLLPDDIVNADSFTWADVNTGIGWREITRVTLGANSDSITTSSFTRASYLMVVFFLLPTGGTITGQMRFGTAGSLDTGSNYSNRYSSNGAADTTSLSQTSLSTDAGSVNETHFAVYYILNISSKEKLVVGDSIGRSTTGATNVPNRREFTGKYANTSAQINIIGLINTGTGDFATGSQMIVLGRD